MSPETLNRWRVAPRVLVMLYGYVCWDVATWFMALPDPSGPQAAFVSTIWAAAAAWFHFYTGSGCPE